MRKRTFWIMLLWPFLLSGQETYKLDNGMTVILNKDKKVPLVTFQVWVRSGSLYELDYPGSGISHYIEHLLFTDTKKKSGLEIAKFMKEQGCDMNGYTTFEDTVFHFTLPSENLRNIIPVVKEMILDPGFKDDQVEKEKNVILKEINMNIDDPERFFNSLIFSETYDQSFYQYPVIGLKDFFMKIRKKDLLEYYQKEYVPDNMAVIISGDFDESAKELVQKEFGSVERRSFAFPGLNDEPDQLDFRQSIRYRKDIKLARLALVWKTVDIRHKDLFALDVLSLLLGSGNNSILNKALKEKLNYVSSIGSSSFTPVRKGIFLVQAELNPDVDFKKTQAAIIKTVEDTGTLLLDEQLKKIKAMALKNYYKSRETITSVAADLGMNWSTTGDIYFSKYYTEGLRNVTKKDIHDVVRRYFTQKNLSVVVLLPETEKKETLLTEELEEEPLREVMNLENQARIVLNRNLKLPLVDICLLFKAGPLFEPKGKKGISHFLSKILVSSTKNYTKEELINLVEGKGGSLDTFSGNNSIGLSIEVFKEDLPNALKVLHEILFLPGFNEKEMERYRLEILQEIRQNKEQIFSLGRELLFKAMYGDYDYGDPKTGSEESIKSITLEDLKAYYAKVIRPSNTVLSISGDFDMGTIRTNFKAALDPWIVKGRDLEERTFVHDYPSYGEIVNEINKEQSLVYLAYYGVSVRDEDRLRAELAWYILNGQGSRIFTNLREKKELAYYAGLFPFYGLTTGLFVFYVGTVQDKIDLAKQGLVQELDKLIKDGITKEELEGARKEFLSDKLNVFQANSSIVSEYGFELLYNNRIRTFEEYKDMIGKIDLEGMNAFIRKYFDQPFKFIILKGQ